MTRWESVDSLRCWLLWCAHMAAGGDDALRDWLYAWSRARHGC